MASAGNSDSRFFYGWWIVAAGFAIRMLSGGLLFNSFGVYFVVFQTEFGWSRTVLAGAFSLMRVERGILGPLQGWVIDRVGPRPVVTVGVLVFGAGFVALSQVHSLPAFYLAFLLLAIGSSLAGFMAVSTAVANWFVRRRATAIGIAMTGAGMGGVLVPALAWFLGVYGWRTTAFVSGIAVVAVGIPTARLIRHRPEDYGYLPDGEPHPRSRRVARSTSGVSPSQATSFTAREALRTPAFWLISFGHASALLVVGAVMVHLVPHTVQKMGLSLQTAGVVVAVLTTMDIAGRLTGGVLGDHINKRIGVAGCMVGHAFALLVLAYATGLPMVLMFSVVHGLSWGMRGPMLMALRADYFGRASYGTIMGFSSLITMSGMVVGPILPAIMADRLGDYRVGFTILAGLAGLGSLLFLVTRRPSKPSHD